MKTPQCPPPAPHAPTECSGQAGAARGKLGGRRALPVARPYRAAVPCSWDARGQLDACNLHQAGQCSPRASPGGGDARGRLRGAYLLGATLQSPPPCRSGLRKASHAPVRQPGCAFWRAWVRWKGHTEADSMLQRNSMKLIVEKFYFKERLHSLKEWPLPPVV